MRYSSHVFAANDHQDLQLRINAWLRYENPARIHSVRFVADGSEFTYCVLVVYVPGRKSLQK